MSRANKLPMYLIVDIDGCLAKKVTDRSMYDMSRVGEDAIHEDVQVLLNRLQLPVVLLTGRTEEGREATETWLAKHHIDYYELIMRGVNEKSNAADFKKRILYMLIEERGKPLFCLEDSPRVVKAFREEMDVTCFHVRDEVKKWKPTITEEQMEHYYDQRYNITT